MPRLHEAIHPKQSDAPMPFAPGILVTGGKILFISGCTALNLYHSHPHRPEEFVFPEDTGEQARRVLNNIRLTLNKCGVGFNDIVKVTKFFTNIDDQDAVNAIMKEPQYFGSHLPTSTTVEVKRLVVPGLKLEIEAVAVVPDKQPAPAPRKKPAARKPSRPARTRRRR